MQVVEGNALGNLCDYTFGDHLTVWDEQLTGEFEVANLSNFKFLKKCEKFEGKVMTLFIDNMRLYNRDLDFTGPQAQTDAEFVKYLMTYNNLLELCRGLPKNKFIIFTSNEDTALDDTIQVPDNVLAIHAVNGYSIHPKVHPFPIGLQRKRSLTDNRLDIMKERLESSNAKQNEPSKLLYINCGIERNPERLPLLKFETNDWCTTRFDKDSMFFPYEQYSVFLDELQDHKFVACPKGQKRGNLDCFDTHRLWETLYMRRVPVMIDHPYFRRLLEGFPVLFIANWNQITKDLLSLSMGNKLYEQVQTMDLSKLDLEVLYKKAIELT